MKHYLAQLKLGEPCFEKSFWIGLHWADDTTTTLVQDEGGIVFVSVDKLAMKRFLTENLNWQQPEFSERELCYRVSDFFHSFVEPMAMEPIESLNLLNCFIDLSKSLSLPGARLKSMGQIADRLTEGETLASAHEITGTHPNETKQFVDAVVGRLMIRSRFI